MAKKASPRTATALRKEPTSFFSSNADASFHWWMIIPLIANPILMIHSIETLGFAGVMVWLAIAATAMFFTIRAPWTLLAANPLYLLNGVHTVDFYIKAIYIALVMALSFLLLPSNRKSGEPLQFSLPELFWMGYMLIGAASMTWAVNASLTLERVVYLAGYGIGGYLLAKQTKFWRTSSFWNTYVAVALVVGVVEMLMYFLGGEATMERPLSTLSLRQILAFDWIMSAGRPSTTLAYRAYAGTWMSTALPFLAWFMFSKHIKSLPHFLFAGAAFAATFAATFEIRARSAWIGIVISFACMAIVFVLQKRWERPTFKQYRLYAAGFIVAAGLIASLPPSPDLIEKDRNPQTLRATSKEDVGNAIVTIGNFAKVGQNDRFDFWSMSKRMMFEKSSRGKYEHPFGIPAWYLGLGINQFPLYVPMYSGILHNLGAEIHNDWVQAFVELGPIGFVCFSGFMLSLLYYALRESKRQGLMLAAVGGILGWVFATQTDFATPRVYGAIWIAAIAAMIVIEAEAAPVLTIRSLPWSPWLRRLGGVFMIWLAASWGITMWCDRQIYIMLTKGDPVDSVTDRIFNKSNWNSYQHGLGKYLIFSPVQDMSRALSLQIDRLYAEGNPQAAKPLQDIQRVVLNELLEMHPTSYAFMGTLSDINYRQGNRQEALKYVQQFLAIKPDDWNTTLFCAQIQLESGDSADAAQSIYRCMQLAPQQGLVQEFWQTRLGANQQAAIIRANESLTGLAPIGGVEKFRSVLR
jgi:hypothetical protein